MAVSGENGNKLSGCIYNREFLLLLKMDFGLWN